MAVPRHPAFKELLDEVVKRSTQVDAFSEIEARDRYERSGPGVWTDVLLAYAEVCEASSDGACCCERRLQLRASLSC
eukprot:scaffold625_cov420-Prasinococcus_capsulatus_cf.AAC.24